MVRVEGVLGEVGEGKWKRENGSRGHFPFSIFPFPVRIVNAPAESLPSGQLRHGDRLNERREARPGLLREERDEFTELERVREFGEDFRSANARGGWSDRGQECASFALEREERAGIDFNRVKRLSPPTLFRRWRHRNLAGVRFGGDRVVRLMRDRLNAAAEVRAGCDERRMRMIRSKD